MMGRALGTLIVMWMTLAEANTIITENSGVSLLLFVGGISATAGMVWWFRGDRDRILKRICRLEEWREQIEGYRARIKHHGESQGGDDA